MCKVRGKPEKLAQQPQPFTSAWETNSFTSHGLCDSVSVNITQSLAVSVVHPPTPPNPPPPLHPTSSLSVQLLASFLIQYERLRGVQSSGVLFIFWFLCVLCAIVPFRSKILQASSQVRHKMVFIFHLVRRIFSSLRFFFLLLRLLSSLMESLKKFSVSSFLHPRVCCCYGVAACGCFVLTGTGRQSTAQHQW